MIAEDWGRRWSFPSLSNNEGPFTRVLWSWMSGGAYTCELKCQSCWLPVTCVKVSEEPFGRFDNSTEKYRIKAKKKNLHWIQVDLFQSGLERSESCQNSPTDLRDREAFGRLREHSVFASLRRRLLAPAFLIWWFSCSWVRVPTDRYGQTPEILWRSDVQGGFKTT